MGDGSNDTLYIVTGAGADTITISSPAAYKVTIAGAGWVLNLTHGDVIDIDTGAGDDVVTIGNLGTTDLNDIVLHLGDGNDRLDASATKTDVIAYGEAGDDVFVGGGGNNFFDGGAGTDLIDYSAATARVKVHLDGAADENGRGGYDQLCGIENVKGSAFADYIWGNSAANVIDGGAGNDEIHGGDGDDVLTAGTGNDTIYGENGNDLISGGAGNDVIDGGSGTDYLWFPGANGGAVVTLNSLGAGTANDGLGGTDTLRASINGAIGTIFTDTLTGSVATFYQDPFNTPAPTGAAWWWNWWQTH
jgi:Ca2+-binding RTX toxin-like protein